MSYKNISSEELIKMYWKDREEINQHKNADGYLMYNPTTYHLVLPYIEEVDEISLELMRRGVSIFSEF